MNLKFLLPFLTLFFLASCAKEEEPQIDEQDTMTVLEPIYDSETSENSRAQGFRDVVFDWHHYNYRASYQYKNSSGNWVSLHPGQTTIQGDVTIPLTFNTSCRLNRRMIRVQSLYVNNPACVDLTMTIPGNNTHYVCQNPIFTYVDEDEYVVKAGTNGWNFSKIFGNCQDENYIDAGADCNLSVGNPSCN